MSSPSLFKPCYFQQRHLENAVNQASIAWNTFQRIEKMTKPQKKSPPDDNNSSKQAAERYADIILRYSDPTSIESSINAAFSSLDAKSLKMLGDYLEKHLIATQNTLQNAKPVLKPHIKNQDITIFGDAYIKVTDSCTSF